MGHQLSDAWVMTREASERAEPTDVQATFNHAMPVLRGADADLTRPGCDPS